MARLKNGHLCAMERSPVCDGTVTCDRLDGDFGIKKGIILSYDSSIPLSSLFGL